MDRPGPPPAVSDLELAAAFVGADPGEFAAALIRRRFGLSNGGAYLYVGRAVELGLVERRGRSYFPVRSPGG